MSLRACSASLAVALILLLLGAQSALATFHEMMIREVYPGSVAHPNSEYVELQMWSAGQNFVGGHSIGIYDHVGRASRHATFAARRGRRMPTRAPSWRATAAG